MRLKGPRPRFVSESPSYPLIRGGGCLAPRPPPLDDVIWPAEDMNGKHVSLVSWFIWLISPGIHLICYILHKLPSSQLSSQHNKLASNEPLIPGAWRPIRARGWDLIHQWEGVIINLTWVSNMLWMYDLLPTLPRPL